MLSVTSKTIRIWAFSDECFSGNQYNQSKEIEHKVEEGGEVRGEAGVGTTAALQESSGVRTLSLSSLQKWQWMCPCLYLTHLSGLWP